MTLTDLTLFDLAEKIRAREVKSTDAVEAYLKAIEEKDPAIKGYITVCAEAARAEAQASDKKIAAGQLTGPLAGVPIAIKDNINTLGVRTTCGSKMLSNYNPIYNATVMEKLKAAGAILLGKTNMDEFAMGSSTETSHFGVTRNPIDPAYIPGGSSGGSAAVVAAHTAPAALGSDTGGSIRQPAACCGVVGVKPTYGRVSRYGLVAFASSLDQIGPLTRDVRDSALLLKVICGHDPRDSTAAQTPVPDFVAASKKGVKGLKIGIPKEYFAEGLDEGVRATVLSAIDRLKAQGATAEWIDLPHTEFAVATYYIIATAEASSNLARYDGVKYGFRSEGQETLMEMYTKTRSEGFGREVKRRILLGTYVLSSGYYDAYYKKAQQVRTLIGRDFDQAFQKCDVVVSPTMPTPPFKLGEKLDDPLAMYLSDIYTIPLNLAGLPGLVVPFRGSGQWPVGVQVIGRNFEEETLLRAGGALM